MTFLRTGAGSVAVPGLTSYVPPSASATALTLSDDSETTVNLSGSFPYGAAGSTNSLVVCSNAFVSVASGNGASFVPDVNAFLTASQTAWRSWHDYNPARSGSGQVKFEQVGAIAYVTWDGVLDFSTASTLPSTLQFQFDLATGNVHIHWVSMSGGGNGHLVGFSPGGSSNDGGSQDLSVALAGGITIPPINVAPLTLAATTGVRPIVNTVMSLETANITPTAPFGAVLFSWTQFDPGISLAPVGMAGCFQYTGGEVTFLFFPAGAPTAVTTFTVPNAPGLTMHAQSAVFDPASGLTVLGAVSSNGLTMGLGSI
jgi:hypothetical protein